MGNNAIFARKTLAQTTTPRPGESEVHRRCRAGELATHQPPL